MAEYSVYSRVRHWPRRLLYTALVLLVLLMAGVFAVRYFYNENLKPVSSSTVQQVVTVEPNDTPSEIGTKLENQELIRSSGAFEQYVRTRALGTKLQAGTYKFSPSQSTDQIARAIAEGKVAVDLVTIVPGARLTQITEAFIKAGFDASAIEAALEPSQYSSSAALTDKPAGVSLEGFLYPNSYQKSASTDPKLIIQQSLAEMAEKLTPELRSAYTKQGLSVYQAVTLASMIEREVSDSTDRAQAAQVFLKRLRNDIALQSDVTALYGAVKDGQTPSVTYESSYNTYTNKGLPPGPISTVSESSLRAVAFPANTDWQYFVAGDDGQTYFSKTLAEHEALTKQYCQKLCNL